MFARIRKAFRGDLPTELSDEGLDLGGEDFHSDRSPREDLDLMAADVRRALDRDVIEHQDLKPLTATYSSTFRASDSELAEEEKRLEEDIKRATTRLHEVKAVRGAIKMAIDRLEKPLIASAIKPSVGVTADV
jgi:septal ring factor EnvC (AmiA/AmiB activator)